MLLKLLISFFLVNIHVIRAFTQHFHKSPTLVSVMMLFLCSSFSPLATSRLFGGKENTAFTLLKNPWKNKGTSYSAEEREKLGLHGLLPAGDAKPLDLKVEIAIAQLRKKATPIDKYIFLHTIQDSDETLFYAVLAKYTKETMPLVYTPTVGQACLEWSHIYRQTPRGLYIGLKDAGRVEQILANYPNKDIKVIVLTDGERILGLGDLGSNGMGIPIGKLALYSTCAGIHPEQCLPVMIDVGTNTESILNDPAYVGVRQKRDRSPAYDALIEEFFSSAQKLYGRTVLFQFEDFGNTNAFRLLDKYRPISTTFNDDIQGTASVVLAGLLASNNLTGKKKLADHRFLFLGAGEAGIGIADLISSSIAQQSGLSLEEAKKRAFFVDSKGIVHSGRTGLEHHKLGYAHDLNALFGHTGKAPTSLSEAIDVVKPTAIIGVSAQGGAFTKEVVEKMTKLNEHPIIFALSNPTNKAECTAVDAYTWSNGKCIFASGSPFDPVTLPDGRHFVPGQGNNAYIFPAVGLAAVAAKALTISDDDFLVAATALAELVPKEKFAVGCCYPDLSNIRDVSQKVAAAVSKNIYETGRSELTNLPKDFNWFEHCGKLMYYPSYNN